MWCAICCCNPFVHHNPLAGGHKSNVSICKLGYWCLVGFYQVHFFCKNITFMSLGLCPVFLAWTVGSGRSCQTSKQERLLCGLFASPPPFLWLLWGSMLAEFLFYWPLRPFWREERSRGRDPQPLLLRSIIYIPIRRIRCNPKITVKDLSWSILDDSRVKQIKQDHGVGDVVVIHAPMSRYPIK